MVGLAREISRDITGRHIGQQLVRAATSAGASYEEARRAIAAKEMGETVYWLLAILVASTKTARQKL